MNDSDKTSAVNNQADNHEALGASLLDRIPEEDTDDDASEQQTKTERQKNNLKTPDDKPPKSNFTRNLLIIGAVVLLLIALVIGAIAYYNSMLSPVSNSKETIIVEIPQGSTVKDVANLLYQKRLIRSKIVFESYASRHSTDGKQVQAGDYAFTPSMSTPEIFQAMLEGETNNAGILIPEGKNIKEIAEILDEHDICSKDSFLAEVKKTSYYKSKFPILDSVPDNAEGREPLEGYLYPDSYQLSKNTKPEDVVSMMLERFSNKYNDDMLKRTKEMNKTVDEIVTMASIVELESKYDEDKANIASVFYNRLAQNMNLQSDITVNYALDNKKAVLSAEEMQTPSPYSTYTNKGLPIGPICSPGQKSLEAALHPADTKYLYFVADLNTGKVYFNETYEGHEQAVAQYMNGQ